MSENKTKLYASFAFLSAISIFLISTVDRVVFRFLNNSGSPLAILADLRMTSLFIVLLIYLGMNKWFRPETERVHKEELNRAIRLAVIWIAATIYFVLIHKVWVPKLTSWVDYVAFMGTGLLAEELLFRGALYNLSVQVFGTRQIARFSIPVWMTSILFGLQHLGYHHFQITQASVTQVIYTTVMGLFFCNLREASRALWPVILLHLLTNSFTVIRNLGIF